ncbi:HEPN domain-containing protein [Acinetobacter gyllenbergii]|uniref:HEPN domain-containing protein n=1 Tax=Acinetobacter gyllenbergii TaxID=134534 RepID=UPI0003BE4BA4|nr:HEPN domain-containing protein [Acinetobacter gyllenbergii]ESK53124.1 hypothetical protein F987_01286 [Acinetobacter gyllenbergii NIPH 230]
MNLEEIKKNSDYLSVINMYEDYKKDDIVLSELIRSESDLISFYTNYNNIFPKLFAVAAANFFEKYICDLIILTFCDQKSLFSEFISNQALERKYHSMFNWKESNANQFYGLFGETFKEHMKSLLKHNTLMKDNEKEFMFLGKVRNEIVHKGISTYNLNKTASEINTTFEKSILFITFLFDQIKAMHLIKEEEFSS